MKMHHVVQTGHKLEIWGLIRPLKGISGDWHADVKIEEAGGGIEDHEVGEVHERCVICSLRRKGPSFGAEPVACYPGGWGSGGVCLLD